MNKATGLSLSAPLQRARGAVEVRFCCKDGRNALETLYQSGCSKALLPRVHAPVPEAVLINTSGGATGGDRLNYRLSCGDGAAMTATTQAAERIYRASGGEAKIRTQVTLGAGARLDWLPQETILFDGGRLDRRLEVEMDGSAAFLGLEILVLGRAAMGETVTDGLIRDHWRIRRDGRLVHAEALDTRGEIGRGLTALPALSGCRAFATLVFVAPGAEERVDGARALLEKTGNVQCAATAKPGILIVRWMAAASAPLRAEVIRFLMAFRQSDMPRVWSL